jgi:RNA polymerase-binding transcription factor DksA
MDEKHLEQADAITATLINAGIAKARRKQLKPIDFEGFCTCGAEIPVGRVVNERYNCVDCQSALERRGKFFSTGV